MFKRRVGLTTLVTVIVILSTTLTGCWDKIEIEERAYAITIGLDANDLEGEEPLSITFVVPNPAAVIGESDEATISITGTGTSLYEVMRRIGTRSNKDIYLGHFKTVLIGEEIAKHPMLFREVLDALEKDPHISRKVHLAITEGTAKEVLAIEPTMDPDVTQYIRDIMVEDRLTNRAPLQSLSEIFSFFHRNGNGIITKITPGEDDVKIAGAAVFKDFKFLGFIGEEVNRGLMFLRDNVELGVYVVQYNETKVPIEINDAKTSYSLVRNDNDFKIIVEVFLEGDIRRFYFHPDEDILDTEVLEELEELLNIEVKNNINHTLNVLQNEYAVDVIGFDSYIEKFHPTLWREINNEYEEIFPQMDIVVNVDANIRRVGLSR